MLKGYGRSTSEAIQGIDREKKSRDLSSSIKKSLDLGQERRMVHDWSEWSRFTGHILP